MNVIFNKEIIIKNLPTKKIRSTDSYTGECYQTLKKELVYKLHQELEKGTPHNSFYEVSKTLIPKLDKDIIRKVFRLMSLMNTYAKIINKILINQIQKYIINITHIYIVS